MIIDQYKFSTGELNQVQKQLDMERDSKMSTGGFSEKINFLIKNQNSQIIPMQSPVVVIEEDEETLSKEGSYRATSAGRSDPKSVKKPPRASSKEMCLEIPIEKDPSIQSEVSNLSRRSNISHLNLSVNLSSFSNIPPILKKNEKGKYIKEEHIVKTIFRKQRSGCPSRLSSLKDYPASKLSDNSSINNFVFPVKGNKDMNMMELIKVKREETEMSGIRKRVCRKIYSILYDELKVGKMMAKRLTLGVEARINHFYSHNQDPKIYIKVVKLLFKKVRVSNKFNFRWE